MGTLYYCDNYVHIHTYIPHDIVYSLYILMHSHVHDKNSKCIYIYIVACYVHMYTVNFHMHLYTTPTNIHMDIYVYNNIIMNIIYKPT